MPQRVYTIVATDDGTIRRVDDAFASMADVVWEWHDQGGTLALVVWDGGPHAAEVEALLGHQLVSIDERVTLAEVVGRQLVEAGATVATAESCTGGLVAHLLSSVPGSSRYLLGGVVAYANEVKQGLLGVDPAIIETHGAVSGPCVEAMARGVRARLGARVGVATSGIAGPGGATEDKPRGLVYVGLATDDGVGHEVVVLEGPRHQVQRAASLRALDMVRRYGDGVLSFP